MSESLTNVTACEVNSDNNSGQMKAWEASTPHKELQAAKEYWAWRNGLPYGRAHKLGTQHPVVSSGNVQK